MTTSINENASIEENAALELADELGTSVGKALAIIKAFDSGAPTLGVSEIARRVNLPKSTAFRLLGTLERNGFVERRGSGYCIGRRLFELGNLTWYCRPRSLRDVALPFMVELVENTHQTVHLGVLDGTDVLYVEKLYGHASVTAPSYVGGRVPARCAAIGKAMLAFASTEVVDAVLAQPITRRTAYTNVDDPLFLEELEQIRIAGVAFDHEEVRLGLTCVGAPILRRNHTIAGISIAGRTTRFDPKQLASYLLRVSAAITNQLGG